MYDLSQAHEPFFVHWPFQKAWCNWRVCQNNGTPTLTHHANVLSAGFNQRCLGVAANTPD